MFGSILNRMILAELFKVFLLSLTALTGMFLLAGLVQEASQRGLSASQIFMAIPLLIPNTLPYTIPATTLFATCVVYGRMANDNEVLVLKAAGVNILHLLKPAILLGLVSTGATMFLYYETIPMSQQVLREKIMNEAEEVLYATLKRDRCLRHGGMPYVIFVKEVQGKRLLDVILKRRVKPDEKAPGKEKLTGYDVVLRAREARLRVDRAESKIFVTLEHCSVDGEQNDVNVNNRFPPAFPIDLPESIFGKDPKMRPSSLTWEQLPERLIEVEGERDKYVRERDHFKQVLGSLPKDHAEYKVYEVEHFNRVQGVKELDRLSRVIKVEQHFRPAIAVGCLCFVLIGCPVGIWASRADYLSSFIVCFLPTIFVYYPLLLAGTGLGKDGKASIPLSVWSADAILGVLALGLIWRLMRR
jgi:lipopolysaccharide export system permease protein